MSFLSKVLAAAIAALVIVSLLPAGQAAADEANPDHPPAGKFPDIDRALNHILKQRTTASAEIGGPAEAAPIIDLNASATGSVQATRCPRGAEYCVRVEPVSAAPQRDVTPVTNWPNVCSANQSTVTRGWKIISRKAGCSHQGFSITVYHVPSGAVLGKSVFHFGMTAEEMPRRPEWRVTGYMALWFYSGFGRPTSILGSLYSAGRNATARTNSWTRTSTNDTWEGDGVASSVSIPEKKSVKGVGAYWRLTLINPNWSNSVVLISHEFTSRCDRYYKVPGCVFNTYPGVLTISAGATREYAKHVSGAIKSGLPGKYETKSYLHRMTDAFLNDKNRTKACPDRLRRPKGRSCDEYPFASTKEGAYTSKASKARSQPWCKMEDPARTGSKGWSRCFIRAGQNSSGGTSLVNFYKRERMLKNDRFQVAFS